MRHAIVLDGVRERFCDVLLPDEILEGLWAPLSGYDLVAHLEVFSRTRSVLVRARKHILLNISDFDLPLRAKTEQLTL